MDETYCEIVSQGRAATGRSSVARSSDYDARGTVREAAEETAGARTARSATRIILGRVQCRWQRSVTRDGWRWIVDGDKGDGKRYIVQSDELLSAFLELETTLL